MGIALSRDLFYFGFFVAAAEFRLGFGRCQIGFRDVLTAQIARFCLRRRSFPELTRRVRSVSTGVENGLGVDLACRLRRK